MLASVLLTVSAAAAQDDADFFTSSVQPVLEANCFECHGPEARRAKGGLRMIGRPSLLTGGGSGPSVLLGDVDGSLLIQAVRRLDPDLAMPPRTELSQADVDVLVEWVARGLPWPGGDAPVGPEQRSESAALQDASHGADDAEPGASMDSETMAFFESRIRPLLIEKCYECHGPQAERPKGGLRLGHPGALARGGMSGPAVRPGDPDASVLVIAVRYDNADLQMPPDGRLSQQQVDDLEAWVALGAPWPDDGIAHSAFDEHAETGPAVEEGRTMWAFSPVLRPVPPLDEAQPDAHPIDAFVSARLHAAGLAANGAADARTLARRTWFDLTGLPPTKAQLDAFVADSRPDAHARLVDRLLELPAYGQRWARHWLDVVRYAQTDGYERDAEKPQAWRYRDWVIDAFNSDMPYDRFVREQLAGDELDQVTPGSLVATGFYRLGVWDSEPDDGLQAEFDELDDIVRTIGEGFLGLTLGCARCHDHKFDPIGQDDYYSTLAFVRGIQRYEPARFALNSSSLTPLQMDAGALAHWEEQRAQTLAELDAELSRVQAEVRTALLDNLLQGLPPEVAEARRMPAGRRSAAQKALLVPYPQLDPSNFNLAEFLSLDEARDLRDLYVKAEQAKSSFEGDLDWALVVKERGAWPPPTHVLGRGLAALPGDLVPPTFVRVLCDDDDAARAVIPTPAAGDTSSGRRRVLADWIASADNPLTARVMVNRIWQHHFGRGLVGTPNDFGAVGQAPTHPELLDWLAAEFIESGWSVKHMHRLILASQTWQRSSLLVDKNQELDPGNELLWRQSLRRLDAEVLRDAIAEVSGGINPQTGGRGYFPELSREALAGGARPGEGWQLDPESERNRRSIYAYVKRSSLGPVLEAFDFSNTASPVGARVWTTSANQAFVLLNGAFVERQAARLVDLVQQEVGTQLGAQIERLFVRVLGRAPEAEERDLAYAHLLEQAAAAARLPAAFVFRPRLPSRVDEDFLVALTAAQVMQGPETGWTYLKGSWGNPYSKTLALDLDQGPAALLDAAEVSDVLLRTSLRVHAASDVAALLLRAGVDGQDFTGVELHLDVRAGRVGLRVHGAGSPKGSPQFTELASAEVFLPVDAWQTVVLAAEGERVRVWLDPDGEPLLDVSDARLSGTGRVGVRTWGDALELRDLSLTRGDQHWSVQPDAVSPERRALQSLALVLLNTNEFSHVD